MCMWYRVVGGNDHYRFRGPCNWVKVVSSLSLAIGQAMGVKDLWTILAPIKQEIGLADLAGKTLAVDLSGWVCQADTTKVHMSRDFKAEIYVC